MSKVLKKCQPRIVYPAKQEFRNENVMRIFSDKPKLSKFTINQIIYKGYNVRERREFQKNYSRRNRS